MVLLMQMMRQAAFTGTTDGVFTRIAGRQGGRWAEQTVGAAYPTAEARQQRAAALGELTNLHGRGVLSDDEFQRLRARL